MVITFSSKSDYNFNNYEIDFFRGPKIENIRLNGLEHVIHITACNEKILFRCYK